MENASDALKMAFAIFIFIIAFTTVFLMLSRAKETADTVCYYSDKTNWYMWKDKPTDDITVKADTVISSLYSIYDENIDVTVNINNTSYRINSNSYYVDNELKATFKTKKEALNYINDLIGKLKTDETYSMHCQEIKTDGIYEYGADGTEIAIVKGGTKLFITYAEES